MFCNYAQDDWVDQLAGTEFVANNTISETTTFTPFMATTGRNPLVAGLEPLPSPPPMNRQQEISRQEAQRFIDDMNDIQAFCKAEMRLAQAKMAHHADKTRSPAPAYMVGDRVFVNAKNIRTQRPAKKLDHKRLGPFTITKVINHGLSAPRAYQLDLEGLLNVDLVFHTNLLTPCPSDPLPGQHHPPPPPPPVRDERVVQQILILDSKRAPWRGKFVGFENPEWRPSRDLIPGAEEALADFIHKPRASWCYHSSIWAHTTSSTP